MVIQQSGDPIRTYTQFKRDYLALIRKIIHTEPVHRGPAHAMRDDTTSTTLELMHVTQEFKVPAGVELWQDITTPRLPWAEDHFQERIGGQPLNPPPSEQWWPFARQGNAEHKKDEKFSHTYPERFWPKRANKDWDPDCPNPRSCVIEDHRLHRGIRFEYGDLNDVITLLKDNIGTRQAYLPIWFPEDLTAAREGERVPCSMGYHFIFNAASHGLECVYYLRSCDLVRFYHDDIYMAGRLLQYVGQSVNARITNLIVHINNLHCFPGDVPHLTNLLDSSVQTSPTKDRSHYNFEGLL